MAIPYSTDPAYPLKLDNDPSFPSFRERFFIPQYQGKEALYFSGNSLGLQPKTALQYVEEELEKWKLSGSEAHTHHEKPWISYHSLVSRSLARLTGALESEVVAMNSLTVNLHLMLASFYQPTSSRYKILITPQLFPSDSFAIHSVIQMHGLDPKDTLIEIPSNNEGLINEHALETIFDEQGEEIALVLVEAVHYLTGQALDLKKLSKTAKKFGCLIGLDLAHAIGNLELALHDNEIDFAVWCSYKYLNSGPGAIGGCFIHEKHEHAPALQRLAGWWGHPLSSRFSSKSFHPIPTAEGWQLSNPPILMLACLRASLELFDQATIARLRAKSIALTGYLEFLLRSLPNKPFQILTPSNPKERGAQLSIIPSQEASSFQQKLFSKGVYCDYRTPNIIRLAPAPLYNTFSDIYKLYIILKEIL